jgi:hypothetical protein
MFNVMTKRVELQHSWRIESRFHIPKIPFNSKGFGFTTENTVVNSSIEYLAIHKDTNYMLGYINILDFDDKLIIDTLCVSTELTQAQRYYMAAELIGYHNSIFGRTKPIYSNMRIGSDKWKLLVQALPADIIPINHHCNL